MLPGAIIIAEHVTALSVRDNAEDTRDARVPHFQGLKYALSEELRPRSVGDFFNDLKKDAVPQVAIRPLRPGFGKKGTA